MTRAILHIKNHARGNQTMRPITKEPRFNQIVIRLYFGHFQQREPHPAALGT